ncbi:hypothetical protein [Rhodopila sp.]|uniref:hypothetical protein n=1 Tax=Rhodopila sp. TaxID=2480087 RepID=UPI003D0E2337
MSHLTQMSLLNSYRGSLLLRQSDRLEDSVSALSNALGSKWVVERWSDCGGDLSLIVFSRLEPDLMPTFVLFEQDGAIRLATVENDEWAIDRSFRSLCGAVDALIAMASKQNIEPRHHATRH